MNNFRRYLLPWLWPIVICISVIVMAIFTFIEPGTPLQGIVILWFLILCPGISLVPLLQLKHFLIEITLAIALSLSIDAIAVGIFLYTGQWSPPIILWVLITLSLIGVILQITAIFVRRSSQL